MEVFGNREAGISALPAALESLLRERLSEIIDALGADGTVFRQPRAAADPLEQPRPVTTLSDWMLSLIGTDFVLLIVRPRAGAISPNAGTAEGRGVSLTGRERMASLDLRTIRIRSVSPRRRRRHCVASQMLRGVSPQVSWVRAEDVFAHCFHESCAAQRRAVLCGAYRRASVTVYTVLLGVHCYVWTL